MIKEANPVTQEQFERPPTFEDRLKILKTALKQMDREGIAEVVHDLEEKIVFLGKELEDVNQSVNNEKHNVEAIIRAIEIKEDIALAIAIQGLIHELEKESRPS